MEASRAPSDRPAGAPQRRGALIFGGLMVALIAVVVAILALGGDGTGADSASGCESVEAPEAKDVSLPAPEAEAPSAKSVVFDTSCGSFTVTLDAKRAPKTAASFEYLAAEGVYDGTSFYRVIPGFVVQGGDPTNTGTADAGYSVEEMPPANLSYTRGLVAMAKSPVEPPGTSGSSFFIVTSPADAGLPPEFALVGEVTDGFDTVERIEALGGLGDTGEQTSQPVVVNSATPEG